MRRQTSHFALLVLAGLAAACAANTRIAGSIPVTTGISPILKITTPATKDLSLFLWNRGAADVAWRRLDPPPDESASGVLVAQGGDHRWQATTQQLVIQLTAPADSQVGFELRCTGSARVDIDHAGVWKLP